ncbi:ABC transporter substrate-binding protein [Caballeronia sp. INDeC2]|uniref:ABC transporter substrate-binding protein n=1 Tax=Caballeronia sp. INDeC2 TaxID=2921747 RepID=UPI0020279202|nr:ABC transporter substrate-binding protein [Caballeronia sp. INDeC2]
MTDPTVPKRNRMFKQIVMTAASSMALINSVSALADEPVSIGFTATLTGDFASYGVDVRKGLDLGIGEVNAQGVQLALKVIDDHGQPNDGVLAAGQFCEDAKVSAVVGYTFSSVALAAAPILKKCTMPVVASAVTSPELTGLNKYFRRVILTDASQGAKMGNYVARQMGAKQVYVLYQQDDYGMGVSKAFKEAFTAAGGKIAGESSYNLGTKDFRTILARLKATNPDAIFIGGFYTEAAMIASQGKDIGLTAKLIGTDGALSPQLMQLSGNAAEGMTLYGMFDPGSAPSPQTAEFVKAYKEKYHQDPNEWAALGYDTALSIGAGAKAAKQKGEVNRETMNVALANIKNLPGATGNISFQPDGDRAGSLYYFTVRGGKFVLAGKQ